MFPVNLFIPTWIYKIWMKLVRALTKEALMCHKIRIFKFIIISMLCFFMIITM